MKVELLAYTPDADKIVAAAAKLCYAKSDIANLMDGLTPEKTESFLKILSDLGHESPVEHASFTFGIEGVSRALLAQITRHRIASFSVQSQRYVSKLDFEYVTPPEIEAIPRQKPNSSSDVRGCLALRKTARAPHRKTQSDIDRRRERRKNGDESRGKDGERRRAFCSSERL